MTRLSFELDWHDGRSSVALPVEVRKLNMALVTRTLSSESIELEPGSYYVTAKLPNGEHLFGQSEVAGEHTRILLSPDLEDEPGFSFDETFRSEAVSASFSREWLTRPAFQIRRFVGNVLTGDVSVFEERELDPLSVRGLGPISVGGNVYNTLIQLAQPDFSPLNLVLPIYFGEECQVSLRTSSSGRLELGVRLTHPLSDLLLQYLENNYLQQTATLVRANAFNTRDLLAGRNLSAAALKCYALLRIGDLNELTHLFGQAGPWPSGLGFFPNRFPDESVIRGEVLARVGRHEDALKAFCELPAVGLPFFSEGLSYATARLKLYLRSAKDAFSSETLSVVTSTLRTLQKFAKHTASSRSILTYTGLN